MASVSISIPKASQAVTEGTIAQWLVADGERVSAGQPIYLLETDKVEMEIEAPVGGILRISVPEGSTWPVGTAVGEIEDE